MKVEPIAPGYALQEELPRVPPDLAEWLVKHYSPRAFPLDTPDRAIWVAHGEWALAQHLITIANKQ